MTTTAPTPPAASTDAKATSYVVLEEVGGAGRVDHYLPVVSIKARSAREAIRKAVGERSGTFVAIPGRSFRPTKVKVETQTRVTFS